VLIFSCGRSGGVYGFGVVAGPIRLPFLITPRAWKAS
jgi:hypothetical protein